MNNEPVAWIIDEKMTDCDDNFIWNTGNYPDWQVKDWIPLYTHPVKELNEIDYAEFLPIWKDFIKDAESVLNVQMVAHHFYNLGLRKAQEK